LDNLSELIIVLLVLLFSVVAHEYAHGYAALKQGDTTALALGRLTFNPIKHIDPVMSILLPAALIMSGSGIIFGGAKPVPVNPRNYRQFKRGDIIVSLAGIATNIALAVASTALIPVFGLIGNSVEGISDEMGLVQYALLVSIRLNLVLAMFNLFPIPPLDGSHVMKYLLPPAWAIRYQSIGSAGLFILIAVMIFFTDLLRAWMMPAFVGASVLVGLVDGFILPYSLP
jgi:Zn-dependent protease